MNCKLKTYIYGAFALGLLASCSDSIETPETLLNGSAKTPIAIKTNLSVAQGTRAVDKKFEKNDVLLAYIEAGTTTGGVFSSEGNPFKGLQSLTLVNDADNTDGDNHADLYNYTITTDGAHITETDDAGLQKLYWDNYSSKDYDLRTAGAGIRLKYGYCYNGGTPTTALDETDGTLGWTVKADQSAAQGVDFKKSDLLYAKTQAPVSYTHGETEDSKHGVLILPYSHAMSKITVNVTADEGFLTTKANFASSVLTLMHMNTVCSVDAPNETVESSTPGSIVSYKASAENTTATFQAIVAPGTNLSVGNLFAAITNVDGNNYEVPVTSDMLEGWSTKLDEAAPVYYDEEAEARTRATIDPTKGYLTKSGVHYILDVVIDKQVVTVRATLADWDKVKAEGNAQIIFSPDVNGKGTIASALQADGFDVYKSSSATSFSAKSTTLTYVDNKWTYNDAIYWAGQSDASYFRALSPAGSSTSAVAQGNDILWGTSGTAAISPRTGDVRIDFEHLMSKLSINLKTVSGDAEVDLTDAKITVTNMATAGTYSLASGKVTSGATVDIMLNDKASGFSEVVVPQSIADDAKVVITLKDGTTYSVQLNQCTLTTGDKSAVTKWEQGKDYTYTITLSKQEVTFSAYVKDWVSATAGGNATLDWD